MPPAPPYSTSCVSADGSPTSCASLVVPWAASQPPARWPPTSPASCTRPVLPALPPNLPPSRSGKVNHNGEYRATMASKATDQWKEDDNPSTAPAAGGASRRVGYFNFGAAHTKMPKLQRRNFLIQFLSYSIFL